MIFDSRMAWHFAKDTFKIFLTIDPMEAATRVMKNQRGAEEHYTSVEDACEMLIGQFPSLQISGLTGELAWAATGEVTKTPAVYVVKDGIYAKVD